MISLSHWGMFGEIGPRMFVVPKGFYVPEQDQSEWTKPGGLIRMVRDKNSPGAVVYARP